MKYHLPFFILLIVIFVESSFPAVELPEFEIIGTDKLVHILVYGLLAALCYISLIHQHKIGFLYNSPFIYTCLICTLYGASDEFHQSFVPNRDAEVLDWAADTIGVILIVSIIKYYLSRRAKVFSKID